jgi:hypothetical protein
MFATAALVAAATLPMSAQAQSLPIVGGFTAVTLTSAPTLTGAGLSVGTLGSALFSPGSAGTPLVFFPVTGGTLDTVSFGGSIEHAGSGLSLANAASTVNLTDFTIDTLGGVLTGQVAVGTSALGAVPLFSLVPSGNLVSPFSLRLTAAAAGALTTVFGLPDLTGIEIGTANTLPITSAVPEPSTYAVMLSGLALLAWLTQRRRAEAVPRR